MGLCVAGMALVSMAQFAHAKGRKIASVAPSCWQVEDPTIVDGLFNIVLDTTQMTRDQLAQAFAVAGHAFLFNTKTFPDSLIQPSTTLFFNMTAAPFSEFHENPTHAAYEAQILGQIQAIADLPGATISCVKITHENPRKPSSVDERNG